MISPFALFLLLCAFSSILTTTTPKLSPSLEELVDGILYPRPANSDGIRNAKAFILRQFEFLGPTWTTESDDFEEMTVLGKTNFSNIVARYRSECRRFVLLACHYDSRIRPKGFVGAIDSAAPCAILMDVARAIALLEMKGPEDGCVGLTLVFFDGEEAFIDFDDHDGLYGSKHLASTWANTQYDLATTELERILLFVLIDLIGRPAPVIKSYAFDGAERNMYYDVAMAIEQSLDILNPSNLSAMFTGDKMFFYPVTDDHTPFWDRGIDQILHIIPTPLPDVWHTLEDNREALDFAYISRLSEIMKLFLVEMLHHFEG